MSAKLPAIHIYPGDWLRDTVSGCSIAAQGLWLRMMFVMHDSDRYGYLSHDGVATHPESVARRCGCTLDQYTALLSELDEAGIPSRTNEGIIFSRRMVRDEDIRRKSRKNGKKGGNPLLLNGVNHPVKPSLKMKVKMNIGEEGSGETPPDKPPETSRGVVIPESLRVPVFIAAWAKWERHLKQKQVRTTEVADEQQLQKCDGWGVVDAVRNIEHSIAGNYQGIFPDRTPRNGGSPTSPRKSIEGSVTLGRV